MTTGSTGTGGVRYDEHRQAWLVSDVRSAKSVLTQHQVFSVRAYEQSAGIDLSDIRRFLLADPDRHRLLRRVMTRASTAGQVRDLDTSLFMPAAQDAAASLAQGRSVELQRGFVDPYTREVMYGLIGVDHTTGDELTAAFRVADRLINQHADYTRGMAALRWLRQRAAAVCAAESGDPLPSSILGRSRREKWLTHGLEVDDVVCLIMSLVEAAAVKGHRDVTATLLRQIASLAPAEQTRLRDTRAYRQAVEEALRLQRGLMLPRTALTDTTLGGHDIRAGDTVLVLLEEVGRDPTAFAEPDRYCPWRSDLKRSIAFGAGVHKCVSEAIAKQIAETAASTLLSRSRMILIDQAETSFTVTLEPA